MHAAAWQPTATASMLELRAAVLASARAYFRKQQVLEVETPVLCAHANSDPQAGSLRLQGGGERWLRTSPEYHMKRLLAAGAPDIYQIGKVFRADEAGKQHQPEFTLIEWYRRNFSLTEMIEDTCGLITTLSLQTPKPLHGFRTLDYRKTFAAACGIDPFSATLADLQHAAHRLPGWHAGLANALGNDPGGWLDLLAGEAVYPGLGQQGLDVLVGYPAAQAMLARLDPAKPDSAERFEIFLGGLELANGYRELLDATEQAQRFARDNERRLAMGHPTVEADPALLDALAAGLPDCAGVAVGLDRVIMATTGQEAIATVMSFVPGS